LSSGLAASGVGVVDGSEAFFGEASSMVGLELRPLGERGWSTLTVRPGGGRCRELVGEERSGPREPVVMVRPWVVPLDETGTPASAGATVRWPAKGGHSDVRAWVSKPRKPWRGGVCERGAKSRAAEDAESWAPRSQLRLPEAHNGAHHAGEAVSADEDGELVIVVVHLEVLAAESRVCAASASSLMRLFGTDALCKSASSSSSKRKLVSNGVSPAAGF
jgi:hypothetical protein